MAQQSTFHVPDTFKVFSALSVASEATIWTPASGNKYRLMRLSLSADTAGNYIFRDNTAGTIIFEQYLTANGNAQINFGGVGLLSATQGFVLTCTGPGSSHISGMAMGEEPPGSVTI